MVSPYKMKKRVNYGKRCECLFEHARRLRPALLEKKIGANGFESPPSSPLEGVADISVSSVRALSETVALFHILTYC